MQSQPIAPHHGHEVDPHSAGLRSVIEGEEKHHDEKPTVMSKVKDKVNKFKNKIGKKKQDDGMNRESDTSSDEEEMEVDDDGYKQDDSSNFNSTPTSEPQRVSIGDAEKFEAEKVRLGDPIGDVKEDSAAPKYTNPPARASEPQRVSIGDAEKFEAEKVRLGDAIGGVKEDSAAPKSTNPPARGGEETGMTPVIQSFEAISVSNEPKPELKPKPELEPKPETQPSAPTGSTDQPTVTYTEKLKSMATVPTEYGKNIASTVYDTLSNAGTAVVQKIRGGPPTKEVNTETNREVSQDKGVSVKDYISEKLKPGEGDEALSEVISKSVQRRKEEMKVPEVVATAQTMAGGATTRTMASGTQMVEKIRGAAASVVGRGGGSDSTTVASDLHQEKGSDEAAEPRMQ